jgi:HSP20 family protein
LININVFGPALTVHRTLAGFDLHQRPLSPLSSKFSESLQLPAFLVHHRKETNMPEAASKIPVEKKTTAPAERLSPTAWQPFEILRKEIDQLFDSFSFGTPTSRFSIEPWFRHGAALVGMAPAMDIAEKDKAYEVTAELPGLDERSIDVAVSDNVLTIKGEKKEEKEEKEKNYYLSERRYGAFQRSFQLPAGVDASKIEAQFAKGVLTVTLPKTAEAQKKQRKIDVKSA